MRESAGRARRDGGRASRDDRVGHGAGRHARRSHGAPTRRASSTRRSSISSSRWSAARRAPISPPPPPSRSTPSIDSGPDHRGAAAGALSVRQHAARHPHHRRAAARLSRAERALLSHVADGAVVASIRRARLQLRHRRRRRLHARRLAPDRPARHAARGAAASPVAPTDSFTLALNNYRQTGGGGYTMLERRAGGATTSSRTSASCSSTRSSGAGTITPGGLLHAATGASSRRARSRRCTQRDAPRQPRGRARGRPRTAPRRDTTAPARRAPRRTRLRIIGTNDFHGALEPRPDATRQASAAARPISPRAIRDATAELRRRPRARRILLDGGDEFQGTPASNLAFGRPVVAHLQPARLRGGRARQSRVRLGTGHAPRAHARRALRIPRRQRPLRAMAATFRGSATTRSSRAARSRSASSASRRCSRRRTTRASNVAESPLRRSRADRRQPGATAARARRGLRDRRRARRRLLRPRRRRRAATARSSTSRSALHEPIDAIVSGHTHSLVNATINGIPVVQARSSGTALDVIDLGPDGISAPGARRRSRTRSRPTPAIAAIVAAGRRARRTAREPAGRHDRDRPARDGHAVSARQPHRRRDARRRARATWR